MRRLAALTAATALSASCCAIALGAASEGTAVRAAASKSLVGTFKLDPGRFSGGKPSGSYLRMSQPDGSAYPNPDSTASDKSYTLMKPGTDGGLATGRFQAPPSPAFDGKGNSLAKRIMRPVGFTAIKFSVYTSSKANSQPPSISVSGKKLSGQVLAFAAAWNKQTFNQGSSRVTGTYNSRTRHYVLKWTARIKGGPFNSFQGTWHLEGTFKPRG
jgi:hypothetical protein